MIFPCRVDFRNGDFSSVNFNDFFIFLFYEVFLVNYFVLILFKFHFSGLQKGTRELYLKPLRRLKLVIKFVPKLILLCLNPD